MFVYLTNINSDRIDCNEIENKYNDDRKSNEDNDKESEKDSDECDLIGKATREMES